MKDHDEKRLSLKQKIAHLTTVHHPFDPRIFHKQLKTLQAAGYDAHLVAPHPQSETVEGIDIMALPEVKSRYQRILLQWPAYRVARAIDADCYHFHDPELIPVGYFLQRTTGARVVYDMHEDYRGHGPVEGRLIRVLERWCFSWVDHVVVANASQISIIQGADVPATWIGNYFKPSPHPKLAETGAEATGPFQALYAGVMSDRGGRGLPQLIDLASAIKQAGVDWQLDLVGVCYREDARQRAEARIQQEELDGIIRRVGWNRYVPWRDMMPHFRAADVGVVLGTDHPNQMQKIPTKFYEYMHFGLPILCSDFPLWRRFVERHNCGAVVPPGDTEAAIQMLKRWQSHPDEYRTLSAAAREASKQYRWKEMGTRLAQLYDDLLA